MKNGLEPLLKILVQGKTIVIMNGIVWLAVGHLGAIFLNVMVHGKLFRKWIDDGILDNIFRILSLEAELEEFIGAPA